MTVDPKIGEAMRDSGRKAAECLRAYWPGMALPIDPVRIAERMGVKVLEGELPADISGAMSKQAGEDPIILISRTDSDARKRFTIAHELGHYVQCLDSDKIDHVEFRGPSARSGTEPDEVYANNFAANLLMPAAEVKRVWKEFGKEVGLPGLAAKFFVSPGAMSHRAANLNLDV